MPAPLLITLGDPNGLGPELATRLFSCHQPDRPVIFIGPEEPLVYYGNELGCGTFYTRVEKDDLLGGTIPDPGYYLLQPDELEGFIFTHTIPSAEGGRAAGVALDVAMELVQAGVARALVTCPLNKKMLGEAGYDFPGHTEYLAHAAGLATDEVTMHLCGISPVQVEGAERILRVSLVTTHPALCDVATTVTREQVTRTIRHTADFLARLGVQGEVAVCGLNPHAGESGVIGHEDDSVVGPAVEVARAQGVACSGPYPADSLFYRASKVENGMAAVVAMYHDQGLAPLKLLHFGQAVNVTLGLPFVRTSPDHGTGYDVAGTGTSSVDSFRAAVELAMRLADVQPHD